ncbi:MAG: MaoC family dehydratase N-terminal domain-containing protein [bacterium]|nr:MaoC family dehydratase N-terminal domain-containing protein [bacterium]
MRRVKPFEAWVPGEKLTTRARTVTEADILAFAGTAGYAESLFYDMEHLRALGHARRFAPALLTCAVADGLIIQSGVLEGVAIALLGIERLTAKAPLYAGDTIHVEVEVTETAPSRSKPDRGVVATRQRVINQNGDVVLEYDVKRMVKRGER